MTLAEDIAVRRARLDALRPLSAASLAVLEAWYDVELTYTSNAIEGSTLTRSETAVVLERGLTVGGKPLADHLAAVGHAAALAFARSVATGRESVTEATVRRIHGLVVARTLPHAAGVTSHHQRRVAGSAVVLPAPAKIPAAMAAFADWLAATEAGYEPAFEAHLRLVSIHPFDDGNGRTGRLLMNLMLLRAGYPPVGIAPEHRTAYLDALETAQRGGSRQPYDDLMATRLVASLDDHIAHCELGLSP